MISVPTLKGYIISRNPSCTEKYLKDKPPLTLEHIAAYYQEREKMIDYYIKVLKECYAKYGYDNPFTAYGTNDDRFINPNFGSKSMQSKMRIVHSYATQWSRGIRDDINAYIYCRTNKYFIEKYDANGHIYYDREYPFDSSYKNYFYLLALDEAVYELYKDNKKYLTKKSNHSNLKHKDLIADFVEISLGLKKQSSYPEEITFINSKEMTAMGYEEVPDGYQIDNFLGPQGPGR